MSMHAPIPVLKIDKTPVRRAFERPSPLVQVENMSLQGHSLSQFSSQHNASAKKLKDIQAAKLIDSLVVPMPAPSPRSPLSRGLSSSRGHQRILSSDSYLDSARSSVGSARKRLADSLIASGSPVSHMQSPQNMFAIHSMLLIFSFSFL